MPVSQNTTNMMLHHYNLMPGEGVLNLMDPHTYFIIGLVAIPLLIKITSSGLLGYTKVIYILAMPSDPYELILGRASAELINGANLQNHLGVHVVQSLHHVYLNAHQLPITLNASLLNHYNLSHANYTILLQHFNNIMNFNELFQQGHFNTPSNVYS